MGGRGMGGVLQGEGMVGEAVTLHTVRLWRILDNYTGVHLRCTTGRTAFINPLTSGQGSLPQICVIIPSPPLFSSILSSLFSSPYLFSYKSCDQGLVI